MSWYNGATNVTKLVRLIAHPTVAPQAASPPATPCTGVVFYRVAHDHGSGGRNYCVGVMAIGNGMIIYKADNGIHTFEIPLDSIREVHRNAIYLVAYGAFYIRTKGSVFNFAALNQNNQPQPPDAVLTAIDNAMGR